MVNFRLALTTAGDASWASTWWTPSHTTRGSPSSERSATAALAAWSSSSPMRTGPRRGSGGGLPGGGMAAPRRPLHARLHARGGLLAARAPRGQDRLAGVPRARRRHRDRHVPRGVRHVGGCRPRAAAILEEAEPDALAYLDFPPSRWKRLRTNNVQERTNQEIKRRSRVV